MQSQRPEPPALDANEMSLREHLLAAQAAGQAQAQVQGQHQLQHDQLPSAASSSPHSHNIDPAISGSPYALGAGESGSDTTPDSKRGKRELSQSKRAAQNRAAQRAFRQRKEGYIKKLEDQVRNYAALEESYKQVQNENYQLRDYVISLQSRLIDTQGDYPQPPPAIDLQNPRAPGEIIPSMSAPTAQMRPADVNQLQAAAAAAQAGEYADAKQAQEEQEREQQQQRQRQQQAQQLQQRQQQQQSTQQQAPRQPHPNQLYQVGEYSESVADPETTSHSNVDQDDDRDNSGV